MTGGGESWGLIRGILREHFTFHEIKDIVGAAGLPVEKLSHLQQKASGGASKGQLMGGVDALVNLLDPEKKDSFVLLCTQQIRSRKAGALHNPKQLEATSTSGLQNSDEDYAPPSDPSRSNQNSQETTRPKSQLLIKTVVVVDLVRYSAIAEPLAQNFDQSLVSRLNDQIQAFIDTGLKAVNATRASAFHKNTGDGAILYFDYPLDAFTCAIAIHEATITHNSSRSEKTARRYFRIGIATGQVNITISSEPPEAAGTTIAHAKRLETAAQPGGILIDEATYQKLTVDQKQRLDPKIVVGGKRDERFDAYPILINADGPKDTSPKGTEAKETKKRWSFPFIAFSVVTFFLSVYVFYPKPDSRQEKSPNLSTDRAPRGGFAKAGPFVEIPFKNFGPGDARTVEHLTLIAGEASMEPLFFEKNSFGELFAGKGFTVSYLVLTNTFRSRPWVPPWPNSYLIIETRSQANDGVVHTQLHSFKYTATNPASALYNTPVLVHYSTLTPSETDEKLQSAKDRLKAEETRYDAEKTP